MEKKIKFFGVLNTKAHPNASKINSPYLQCLTTTVNLRVATFEPITPNPMEELLHLTD